MSQGSFHKWLLEMNSKKSAKVPLLVGHAFTFWGDHLVSMDIPIVWEIQNPCCGKSIFGLQLLWEIHICSELVGCLGMVLLVELTTNNTCPVGTWKPVMALHLLKPYLYVYIHIMWDIGECIIVLWIEGNPWKPHSIHWIVFPHLCPHPFFPHFSITLEVHLPSMIWNRASTSSPSISSVRCRRPCASTKRISPGAVSSESCSSMVLMASASNFNWKLPSNDLKKRGIWDGDGKTHGKTDHLCLEFKNVGNNSYFGGAKRSENKNDWWACWSSAAGEWAMLIPTPWDPKLASHCLVNLPKKIPKNLDDLKWSKLLQIFKNSRLQICPLLNPFK